MLLTLLLLGATACETEEDAQRVYEYLMRHGPFKTLSMLMSGRPLDTDSATLTLGNVPGGAQGGRAQIGLPPITFFGFKQDSGQLSINSDFKGDNEFVFPITGQGNQGCVDFLFNGCDSSDVDIRFVPSQNRFEISGPPGFGKFLAPAAYEVSFSPDLFRFAPGPGELQDIVLRAQSDSQPIQFNAPFAPGLVGFMTTLPAGEAGGLRITPTLVVSNPNPAQADVRLDFFKAQDGSPLAFSIDGTDFLSRHDIQVAAQSSRRFVLAGEVQAGTPIVTSWGMVTADQPDVSASVVYSTFDAASGALRGEAGVSIVPAGFLHVVSVERASIETPLKQGTQRFDTAVAIANPTQLAVDVRLELKNPAQETLAETVLPLAARAQTARFVLELFGIEDSAFSGTVVLKSEAAIAVNSLKTLDGIQTSSLESATHPNGMP